MYSKMPRKEPKQWETWHGMHTFLCDGRIMLGPDIGVTGFAAGLTTAASVAFWVWVCPQLPPVVLVVGALLYTLTMFFMIACATTDPGILPRDPTVDDAEAAANAELRRTVLVNGRAVPLKWCYTCRIWRPPRAAHCSECNVCVERFDHHCPWMGQCIGKRNYRYFLGFVASVTALCVYTALASLVVFLRAAAAVEAALALDIVSQAAEREPAACATLVFPAVILLCVSPLGCYHAALVCNNRTTNEEIKVPYGADNPFERGWPQNCHEACCEAGARKVRPAAAAALALQPAADPAEDAAAALRPAEELEPADEEDGRLRVV
jgi:hypothetical protein